MTREKAIKILRKEIECLSHTTCSGCPLEKVCDPIRTTPFDSEYIEVYEMAIKALEQEPILDKIRAEIEKLRPNLRPEQMTDYDYAMVAVVNDIVAIIDKYRTESDIEKRKECPHKPCINHEDGCEEWAGCPCVYYKAESEE